MADITNLSSFLGDVADAIRSKKGSEESIPAKNFDEEILSIKTGIDTSDADATEENIEKGKTAYVNGLKVTGTLEDAGESEDVMVSANNISVGNQRGYDCVSTKYTNSGKKIHKDGWYVNQHMKFEDLALTLGVTPDKIVSGNTILGIEGTGSGGGIDTSDATATAANLLAGKTAYSKDNKITGTMPNNGELNYTPSTEIQTIPAGYTSGGSISPMDITVSKDYKTCEVIADNILGGEKQYTRLEYIQGTGTQYFTIDYTPNQNTKLEITLSDASGANGDATIFGETWGTNRFLLTIYNGTYRYFYGNEYAISDMTSKSVLSFYRRVITRDGTVLNNDSTQNDNVTYTNKLSIFRSTVGGQIASFKLYSLKIYENDTLIRDYIPVKDSSERVCLYETISNRFTYGVGDFISGGVI